VTIKGFIKDGTTARLIPATILSSGNVKVIFQGSGGQTYPATILAGSIYQVKLPTGNYKRNTSLNGYSSNSANVKFTASSDETNGLNTILLVPIIRGWTAVLTWNGAVKDLDLISVGPNNEMVNFQKKVSANGKVTLDVDDRDGFGPETISFKDVTTGKYTLYVHNYSNEDVLFKAAPKLTLYQNGNQVAQAIIKAPSDNSLRFWKVFEINADNGSFNTINSVQASY